MSFIKKLYDIKNKTIKCNKLLVMGTNPLICENLLKSITSTYDYQVIVIDISSNVSKSFKTPETPSTPVTFEDSYDSLNNGKDVLCDLDVNNQYFHDENVENVMFLPVECIIVECRYRNIYKDKIYDFFTNLPTKSKGISLHKSDADAVTDFQNVLDNIEDDSLVLFNIDVVIYIFKIDSDDFNILLKFFNLNLNSNKLIKILILYGGKGESLGLKKREFCDETWYGLNINKIFHCSSFDKNFVDQLYQTLNKLI